MTMTNPGNNGSGGAPTSVALTKRSDEDLFKFGLEPQGFTEALQLCKTIADTGMFSGNKDGTAAKPESLLVRLMVGRSLGVPAMVALQHVYDVYGRPSISARLKVALCLRHPECVQFEFDEKESNAERATYIVQRQGREKKKFTFTMADAAKAGLVKKDSNWEKWPKAMLKARASSDAADTEFPEACMGLPTHEEAEDTQRPGEIRGEVVPPTVPARDWAREAETLKGNIKTAFDSKSEAAMKTARQAIKAFASEAPKDVVADLKDFYNKLEKPAEGAPKPKAAAPTGAAQGAAPAEAPRGEYLPPDQRGDAYTGPESPEDGPRQ